MKKVFLSLLLLVIAVQYTQAQCDYTIPGNVFTIDGDQVNYPPGSTLCLEAGEKDYLLIKNIHGTAAQPIIIKNHGGELTIETTHYYGIKIANCSHVQLTGSGMSTSQHGIKILKVENGAGISVGELSTDIEIDHIEIANTSIAGVYAKSEPDCNFNSTRDKFTMYNFSLHDCYLHDIADEGLYIGSSKYSGQTITCDGKDTTVFPHVIIGARIYSNLVERTGWDGIQVSSAENDCKIFNNTVRHDSYEEYTYQMSGIIIGGGSRCDCYNNQIFDGKGDGIDVLGLGNMKIYNNLIVNAGRTFKPDDPNAFKHGIFIGESVTSPNATFDVFNNTIINPKSNGIKFSNNTVVRASFKNNLITNPGRLPAEGNQAYINGNQASIIKTTNHFSPDNSSVLFLNVPPHMFDLKPNSPAVNAGSEITDLGVDFDIINRNRPFHTYIDIGAFECHDPQASITESNTEQLKIFPNPAKNFINVSTGFSTSEIISVRLYNSTGEDVSSSCSVDTLAINELRVNISDLKNSYYILELNTTQRTYQQSFIVNR
ncbi:MAG: right-handed parallel beta-helix repeat-containing protein [Bacteroidales bacterium]|nr:right-handed parallel beta-helix repeat-containing protein [Bacteroidales bacterium]